ncbi:tyrosine-type recombinase/integrase [Spirosoma rhododendri]|uniref:Tyrosine-type recombinase/integrase n=1 Tax=Spirosoma rhododendri TaxID=2728024 RepID=A0A7L5DSX0_9BACT|nr:tyrosine-type recombinase/integrase [Spirosoma rhododendri]QJD81526.1 tyrosine-type recombinase/integrase [Spirosoma rhododendri]
MKQPATDPNAVTITLAQEQRLSLRVDEQLHGEAREYLRAGLQGSANSQRAFTTDIRQYSDWCEHNSYPLTPLSAVALVEYVTFLGRTRSFFTIQRHLASLAKLHRQHNVPSPTTDEQFKVFMKGVKLKKTARQKQAPDFSVKQLRQAIDSLPHTPTGIRNRAILLLGFTGAFRRSELASLDVNHLLIDDAGLVIRLHRSKTNQFGEIEEKAVAYANEPEYCPIGALQQWLAVIDREQGPLFVRIRKGERVTQARLSDEWVNVLVQQQLGESFTAHSLRASFVTVAKANGADDLEVMNQTKHRTTTMIQRYDRRRNIRKHNASGKLGL